MPDRKFVQRRIHVVQRQQISGAAVDEGERWLHRRQIELFASAVWMGINAPVCDGQRYAILQKKHFVGIEAMALQFSDAPEARPGIVNPENSAAGIEIVFGRIEQPPILREDAVSAEVAIRRGFKDD